MVWYSKAWQNMVSCGVVVNDIVWYGMAWHGMVLCGMVCYNIAFVNSER